MNGWIESFNFSIIGAMLLLSMMGLWFVSVIPGIDRWSRRFFMGVFTIFLLCCLLGILETLFQSYIIPSGVFYILLLLETILLSLLPPILTVYLLHCSGENMRKSRLFRAALGIWAVSFAMFASSLFIDGFVYITPKNQYFRGPLYPFSLLPLFIITLLNLAGTIRRRKRLSRKAFIAFLIAILPIAVALAVQLFIDAYQLLGISYILSALAMYSFILSDQIEKDRRQQQEIAEQQREIANKKASIMVLQMRPHFIYNTLISIHSLCGLDPKKAQQVTMDFTNYLRRNFNAIASNAAIPFSTELEHTRAYLAVEQAQYDDMLVVDYDIPYSNFRLPPLTLQPIVENSVKHGMDPDCEPLHISIRTRRLETATEIIVEDSGPGFDPSSENRPYAALTNIRQRLEMMCRGKLTISARKGGGTVVTVTIP